MPLRPSHLTRNAATVYMALPGTVSADDLKSPLEEPKQIAPQAALFSLASLEHSSAHFRQASAQRENASISACLSQALATSSQARAHTSQSGYAYFEPRSSSCVVRVAIRAQSRAVASVAATMFTSGCASPTVTKHSQRHRATLQASRQLLNFGGHIDNLMLA